MSGANMMRGFGNCVKKLKRRSNGMTGGEAGNLSVERSFIIIIIGREMMMMGRMCLIMIMRMKEGGKVESMFLVEVVEVVEEGGK